MKTKLVMSLRRVVAVVIVLATGLCLAHCGGKLIPPADEVTTRMNDRDERALRHADAGVTDARKR